MQKTCQRLSLKYKKLLFCFRDEPSSAGEWHAHFLVAANGIEKVSPEVFAAKMQEIWSKKLNKGMAKIETFNPTLQLEGISYVCKVSRDRFGNEIENIPRFSMALQNLIHKKNSAGPH